MANILRVAGQTQNAHEAAAAAARVCQSSKNKKGQASAYCMAATIYDTSKAYGRAMFMLEKAIRLYRQVKDKKEEAQTLESLANVSLKMFSDLDDVEEPLQLCQKALELYKELGMENSKEVGYLMQTMAFCILALNRAHEAVAMGEESLNIFQHMADRRGEAAAYNVLAQIHWNRNEQDKARTYVSQGLKSAQAAGDASEEAWSKELHENYKGLGGQGPEVKTTESKKLEKMAQKLEYSDIYMYSWGKDYALFFDFTLRGTDQQVANMNKRASSSSRRRADQDEVGGGIDNEMDLGIDWQSMGTI
jgi:tetratricopeptide (TPR) repeat protein